MLRRLRFIVGILCILDSLLLVACTPTAVTSPTPVPAKPAVASEKAAPEAAKPAGSANWKAEWDKTVADAKKEGKVVVIGPRGDFYRKAAMEFQKAYPEIQIDYSGALGSDFGPKVLAERQGGQYLSDVLIGGATTLLTQLMPNNALDPLRPALVLPEVLDDSKWLGGFEDPWLDRSHQYIFAFLGYLSFMADVNREVAPESELSSIDQLLDPKWKGKIAMQDPRRQGAAGTYNGYLLLMKGEAWLRKLLAQDIAVYNDPRQMLEALVRGRYAVIMGSTEADTRDFKDAGLLKNISQLDPYSEVGGRLTAGSGSVALANRAPHPNAAKVFVNWLLTKEGQKAYADIMEVNSRRLDVQGPQETAPRPGIKYGELHKEENLPNIERAMNIAKEIIK